MLSVQESLLIQSRERTFTEKYRRSLNGACEAGFKAKPSEDGLTRVGDRRRVFGDGWDRIRIDQRIRYRDTAAEIPTKSPELFWRGRNLRRELVDVLRFRQGKFRKTPSRRKDRLVGGLPWLPLRRMPLRLRWLRVGRLPLLG